MPKSITITISNEAALWVRRKAAEEHTSVSMLVSETLERRMQFSSDYWRAHGHWKSTRPLARFGAGTRMTREETNERR